MATIERRGKRWRVLIRRVGFAPESATFYTRSQADEWARAREAELVGVRYGLTPKRTVRQALERYRDHVSPGHRGHRWEAIRLDKLARELDFTDRQLEQVAPADIAGWRDVALTRLAPSSVRREYGLLRAVFGLCEREWGWLRASPFRGVRPPPEGRPRSQRVSDAEAGRLCKALAYRRGSRPATASQFTAAAFLWCIQTAMRQGEALSLERAEVLGRVAHLDRTKNGDERDVPLTADAVKLLALLPKKGYLFPITGATCDALFRRARNAAGLAEIHFHDSRREGTTRLAAKLKDPLMLAKITGHRDLKTLLRVYFQPSMADVAVRLD